MTLKELSQEYRAQAGVLEARIRLLTGRMEDCGDPDELCLLQQRVRLLSTMLREARELAVLTERYYERGYRRNVKYTV